MIKNVFFELDLKLFAKVIACESKSFRRTTINFHYVGDLFLYKTYSHRDCLGVLLEVEADNVFIFIVGVNLVDKHNNFLMSRWYERVQKDD